MITYPVWSTRTVLTVTSYRMRLLNARHWTNLSAAQFRELADSFQMIWDGSWPPKFVPGDATLARLVRSFAGGYEPPPGGPPIHLRGKDIDRDYYKLRSSASMGAQHIRWMDERGGAHREVFRADFVRALVSITWAWHEDTKEDYPWRR